ncbi:MAG: single-stranded DNA-binding protein, partial [Dehalococcoidia bacterium]
LENLIMNPTLSDLIGGIQTVTLGDEEAKRRRTQKSVLERKAPPTFDMVVEIVDRYKVTVHPDVTEAVDALLHQRPARAEMRWMDEDGEVKREAITPSFGIESKEEKRRDRPLRFYLFGANRSRLEQLAKEEGKSVRIANDLRHTDLFLTTRSYYRRKPQKIRDAEALGIPIYVLKSNNAAQMRQCLDVLYPGETQDTYVHHLQRLLAGRRGTTPNNRRAEPGDRERSR